MGAELPGPDDSSPSAIDQQVVVRFERAERLLHWAVAAPFLLCYVSAVVLLVVYNPSPERPFRVLFSWTHRISGLCLVGLPALAIVTHPRDFRLHLRNIGAAWLWTLADLQWLALAVLTAPSKRLRRRFPLPEAGKFNAGEKLNFMVVMTSSPLFVLSGVLIWLPGFPSYYPWIFHLTLGAAVTPLLLGHIFMATINPSTRKGLRGMVSGKVDRKWARHHYPRWFRTRHRDGDHPEGGGGGGGGEGERDRDA